MNAIDEARLNFNPGTLGLLNIVLGLIMFGIALDLKPSDFAALARAPRAFLVGVVGQFVLLPALSFLLITIIRPQPSVALGMLLVASCPGGNISNFITHLARGNTALSIGMTAASTTLAIVMTPLNLAFWGGLYPGTRQLLHDVALDPVQMLGTIALLLGVPLVLGLMVGRRAAIANRIRMPLRIFSFIALGGFIAVALGANWQYFIAYVGGIAIAVLLQNALALSSGYAAAAVAGLGEADRRAVAIEVGIQNSALALVLIFNFFNGLGGMAIVAAWWGVWHIAAGVTLATFWSSRPPAPSPAPAKWAVAAS